jgi:hypothetical protein
MIAFAFQIGADRVTRRDSNRVVVRDHCLPAAWNCLDHPLAISLRHACASPWVFVSLPESTSGCMLVLCGSRRKSGAVWL